MAAHEQHAGRNRGRGQAHVFDVVDGEEFEFGAGFDDAELALFGEEVEPAIGRHGRGGVADAAEAFAVDLFAGVVFETRGGIGVSSIFNCGTKK